MEFRRFEASTVGSRRRSPSARPLHGRALAPSSQLQHCQQHEPASLAALHGEAAARSQAADLPGASARAGMVEP